MTTTVTDAPAATKKWTEKERDAIRKAREKYPADTTSQRGLADRLYYGGTGFFRRAGILADRSWNSIYHAIRKHDAENKRPKAAFNVGDRVKIVKRADWSGWVTSMDCTVGLTGKILTVESNIRVAIDDWTSWWYPPDTLEKV